MAVFLTIDVFTLAYVNNRCWSIAIDLYWPTNEQRFDSPNESPGWFYPTQPKVIHPQVIHPQHVGSIAFYL